MKKLIDVTLPITGSITIPVEAESDEEALELAMNLAEAGVNRDYDLSIEVDGNYATLTDANNGGGYREVYIGDGEE